MSFAELIRRGVGQGGRQAASPAARHRLQRPAALGGRHGCRRAHRPRNRTAGAVSPELQVARAGPAADSWVADATDAWQIPEADLAGMMSFTEDEEMDERAKELRDHVHRDGVRQGLDARVRA